MHTWHRLCIAVLVLHSTRVAGFYLPGLAPLDHIAGENITIMTDALRSPSHPNEPLDYYSLAFCPPPDARQLEQHEDDIGEHLLGKSVQASAYTLSVLQEQRNVTLCSAETSREAELEFRNAIAEAYKVNLLLDNLPNLYVTQIDIRQGEKIIKEYELGTDIGYIDLAELSKRQAQSNASSAPILSSSSSAPIRVSSAIASSSSSSVAPQPTQGSDLRQRTFVYTHLDINIDYHVVELSRDTDQAGAEPTVGYRIVGFQTFPDRPVEIVHGRSIDFTYSVYWHPSNVTWGSRWDVYFYSNHELTNTRIMEVFAALGVIFIVASIVMFCTKNRLRKRITDNAQGVSTGKRRVYRMGDEANAFMLEEDTHDIEAKAKQKSAHAKRNIAANIFQRPRRAGVLLIALVCTGIQIIGMVLLTGMLGLVGMLYIEQRATAINAAIMGYIAMSLPVGFQTMRYCLQFEIGHRKTALFLTWTIFPSVAFLVLGITNSILQRYNSTSAIEWWLFSSAILVWALSTGFLLIIGAAFGAARPVAELEPKPNNRIVQTPPIGPCYGSVFVHVFRIIASGVIFGVSFLPLYSIFQSIWGQQFYAMYGIFWLSLAIIFYFAAIVSIWFVYQQLKRGNWLWWWSSFLTAGGASLFALLYALYYYAAESDIEPGHSTVLYFAYVSLIVFALFLSLGAAGFIGTFRFLKDVFKLVKSD